MATTIQSNKELIGRSCDAINNKDREAFMELQDPEVVHHQGQNVLHGADAVTNRVWSLLDAFPDLKITPGAIVAEDDMVAMRYTGTGTHEGELNDIKPTGREFEVSEMKMYRVKDGRIAEVWDASDQLGLLTQLGIVEAPE